MTHIEIIQGDITNVSADALITPIHSYGGWFGSVDRAIKRVAGNAIHAQASKILPRRHGQTIVAQTLQDTLPFRHVIFIIDDVIDHLRQGNRMRKTQ